MKTNQYGYIPFPKPPALVIKTIFLALLLCFSCTVPGMANTRKYLQKYRPIATTLSIEYGIPISVILAIGAIESSSGQGFACKHMHNHFGIVGKNHNAKSGKRKSRYKQYKNAFASYRDFCRVITRKRFYAELKDNPDITLWVNAISKTGYSEKPLVWQKKVLKLIKDYKLTD